MVVPARKEDISNLKWPFCRVQTHTIHRLSDCMTKHGRLLFAHLTSPCYLKLKYFRSNASAAFVLKNDAKLVPDNVFCP